MVLSNRGVVFSIIAGLALFVVGWHTGRVMSPYYAAHPIVFEDKECVAGVSSGGTAEALVELKEAGQAPKAVAEANTSPVVSLVPSPLISAVPTVEPQVAGAQQGSAQGEKLFAGSINSDKYHHKDCPDWKRIKEENLIWFATREEAEATGYSPSKCTTEKLK